ncbi:hypothetical protein FANTH_14827 [Fusarium anthophilum]|uniref:Uncharacterized protein n=1 Tax=Fusarium anthophilum TaxID=48485 RepID=A0A8H5DKR2_9HYPO|nr:hypothetical protein FANTH_14827 [Fusarium anthophilum]
MFIPNHSTLNQAYAEPIITSSEAVSWPSLFWGLVPFAINSMTQPAGIVCGADANVEFLLRSSPVICILDAVLILIRLAYEWHTKSFRQAHDYIISSRFQSEMYIVFKQSKKNKTELTGRNDTYVRAVIFILTLSQFIKIFAFGGITWTKIIAGLYLGSFLFIEAIVVWPVSKAKDIHDIQEQNQPIITYTSIALAVAFMLWFASVVSKDIFGQPHHTVPQWAGGVIGSIGALFAATIFGYSCRHCTSTADLRLPAVLFVLFLVTPVSFYILGRITLDSITVSWIYLICVILSVVWVCLGVAFANETTKIIKRKEKSQNRKRVEQATACYNAAGTTKPGWTQWLG